MLHYVGSATLAAESGGSSLPTIRAGSYWTGTLESEDFQLLVSRRDGRSLEGVGVWPHGATRLEGTVYEHEGGSLTFDLTEVELLVPLEEDGTGAAASSKQRKLPRDLPRLSLCMVGQAPVAAEQHGAASAAEAASSKLEPILIDLKSGGKEAWLRYVGNAHEDVDEEQPVATVVDDGATAAAASRVAAEAEPAAAEEEPQAEAAETVVEEEGAADDEAADTEEEEEEEGMVPAADDDEDEGMLPAGGLSKKCRLVGRRRTPLL